MAGDKPNPTQRPAPARGPGGGALQQRKRPARARLRLTRAFSVPCGDGVAPRARPETRAQPPSARRRGLTRHSHRYGERRPAPCSAARHPALLRRGDAGPQDWSDDRDAAASLSFLQFTVASMAWRWWRSHRHAIAAAIVTHKFRRRERAPRHTLTHADNARRFW